MRRILPALALLIGAPTLGGAQGLHLIPGIAEIASDSIGDIAVAAVDQAQPAIYYNPSLVRRYGPLLTRFFLAHEYGHINRRHTRAAFADLAEPTRDSIFRAQELAADCYAAAQEGPEARAATEAALRFFSRLGPFRFDNEHPTGAQRAAQILRCLSSPRTEVTYGRGETGVEVGPVSGEPELVRFRVATADLSAAAYGSEAVLWMDGRRLGRLSNMRQPRSLEVGGFGAGIHSYRITLDLYRFVGWQQLGASGSVTGRGHVLVQHGDRFRIVYQPGQTPRLERDRD